MSTKNAHVEEQLEVKRYKVQYPISAYTFPQGAYIHQVQFDADYIHIDLTDGRKLSIPLWWIPTLYNAPAEELEKYEINQSRTMLVWDPAKCAINDELRVSDYLGPTPSPNKEEDWLNDSDEQLQAEDARWEATYTRNREKFNVLADATHAEIANGTTQSLFDEDDEAAK